MLTRARLCIANMFSRRMFDRDLADELTFHIDARAEHLERQVMPPAEAMRQARLEFGRPERYKDEVRDARTGAWVEQTRQDLRHGTRVLIWR